VTYFHCLGPGDDSDELLVSANQWSTPWGSADHGRCDKCRGTGRVRFECLSCRLGPRVLCPSCAGVRGRIDRCPACEGSGAITRTRRRGVSVFPSAEGLIRYLTERGEDPAGCVLVELDGPLSGDVDLDADRGALLILPVRVIGTRRHGPAGAFGITEPFAGPDRG
jgi:hypothetical protein